MLFGPDEFEKKWRNSPFDLKAQVALGKAHPWGFEVFPDGTGVMLDEWMDHLCIWREEGSRLRIAINEEYHRPDAFTDDVFVWLIHPVPTPKKKK